VRRPIVVTALVILASVMPVSPSSGQPGPEPVQLRVMSFNIWYGATATDLGKVIEAIEAAEADVVGMQEPYARLRRIALALGFHASPRMHVISRYPILEPAGSDGEWAFLQLGPGRVAAIANTHLPCCPYAPYRIVNRGYDRETILEQERRTRLRRIEKHLSALAPVLKAGIPTFFTGDFNAPSHRDWTREAVEERGLPYPVRWPVSLAMESAGFTDSYRAARPDPVADPGFTWTPGYPSPFVYPWDVHDRIDFVWAAGSAVALTSQVVGESAANADVVVDPWPSDHRAVVSTFEVTPATPPVFVAAAGERSRLGEPLDVTFHAPGDQGEHVALFPAGSDVPVAEASTGPGSPADGTLTFATSGLVQGTYDAVLTDGDGAELARDAVVLVAEGQPPILTVDDTTLEGDQALEVSWRFAPGNRYDWLGVYRAGVSAKVGYFRAWRYMDARVDGSTSLGSGVRGPAGWPLRPGRYEVRLCLDDSYRCRVSAPFSVIDTT
jgi:endonuclease/exonuclease/phosphatase family metal-dependent hydrolase